MSMRLWRMLLLAQWREAPLRIAVTVIAISLGVSLGVAVYLVNAGALNEFGLATKRLVGEADIVVRSSGVGFPDSLYVDLAREPEVAAASPVLEIQAALAGRHEPLKVVGLDIFRALALQPALLADFGGRILDLLHTDGIFLSAAAAQQLHLRRDDVLSVLIGSSVKKLRVRSVMGDANYPQALGIMDIASAQWAFDRLGRLNRVDLRLQPGTSVEDFRRRLAARLPTGVFAVAPVVERDRAVTATRAYRVNLDMLALVALWTGAFLVFSTQSLSVLRRRRSLALLRALGVTRSGIRSALIGEGAAIGTVGSLLGIAMGATFAQLMLRFLADGLGNSQLRGMGSTLHAAAIPLIGFFAVGVTVAVAGSWMPANGAARQPPAQALKGGDGAHGVVAQRSWKLGIVLLLLGVLLAQLPAFAGLPVFGYLAVACLLFGAVLMIPALTAALLRRLPRMAQVVWDTAVAQLRENVGQSTLSLAAIVVSFSLMVAMAIMVYSFRVSFEHWLGKLLPADLQMREPPGSDSAAWSKAQQLQLTSIPGVERLTFRRTLSLLIDPARAPITLIARGEDARQAADELPLANGSFTSSQVAPSEAVQSEAAHSADPPVWISEEMQEAYGLNLGGYLTLPLGGKTRRFNIVGVWRDYARSSGSVVVTRSDYLAATGDDSANEGSLWLDGTRSPLAVQASIAAIFPSGAAPDVLASTVIRERSLQIFDRAFAITYALEVIAVLIGLTGVSVAASSTALARRSEFGMLRHIGLLRRQIIGMLAGEGLLLSVIGVLYGLILGVALSLVLVYVVNRQSFNWSIDLAVPLWQLGLLSLTLIAAAALAAVWSGRAATSDAAIRAVREDW